MSQSNSYTSTALANTSPLPSPSPSTTSAAQHREPLSPTYRRAPSGADEYVLPTTTFTADLNGGGGNSNNDNAYTYNRGRGGQRGEHQALSHEHEYGYGHSQNTGVLIAAPSKAAAGPVSPGPDVDKNNSNVHYQPKSRQQPTMISSAAGSSSIGNEASRDLAGDAVDDDVDRDEDEHEDEESRDKFYSNINGGGESEGYRRNQQHFEMAQSTGAFGRDSFYRTFGSSLRHNTNNMPELGSDLDKDLGSMPKDGDRPQHQSQLQSQSESQSRIRRSGAGRNGFDAANLITSNGNATGKIPLAASQFVEPAAAAITSTGSYSGTSGGTAYTHPSQADNAYNGRYHQPRHQLYSQSHATRAQRPQRPQHQPQQQHGQHSIYHSSNSGHSHRYNPPRQPPRHPQLPQHPRAASSLASYNTASSSPTTPLLPPFSPATSSSSLSSSSSSAAARLARRTSRTLPPTAPPRISSLMPPPRSSTTTTNTNHQPPLSTSGTATAPIVTTPGHSVLPGAAAPPTASSSRSYPYSHSHSQPQPHPDPVSTVPRARSTPPSANAIIAEPPTHAQFAASFLDPLNRKTAIPDTDTDTDTEAALAFGVGIGAGGSGSGSGPGTGRDPGSHPQPPPTHSRASSLDTSADSPYNLNRWSSSTTSSRLSTWDYHHYQQQQARQQKSTAASARRMSVDSIGLLSQHPESIQERLPPSHASPRKLSKRRPSQGTSASPRARARAGSASTTGSVVGGGAIASTRGDPSPPPLPPPPPSAPPPNLPPIISLPPLDTNPESSFRLASPRAMGRASPGLNTPNSVFASQRGNVEPQDYSWSNISDPMRTASPATRANTALLPPAPVTRDRDVASERRGHSRSRSAAKAGSGDSTKTKDRSSNKPSQKAMLSKALSKANTAVQLDNAQNFGAARDAYLEACELLQQVLARTNGVEDRNKLEAIRQTYRSRIEELDPIVIPFNSHGDKALPARPDSFDYHGVQMELAGVDMQSDTTTMIIRSHRDESPDSQGLSQAMRRPSDTTYSDFSTGVDANREPRQSLSRSPMRRNFEGSTLTIPRPSGDNFLPAPLSPRRPLSPARAPSPEVVVRHDFSLASDRERLTTPSEFRSHRRNLSHESASWLDPIDESGGSTASSVHSRSSSRIVRKHIRQASGNTEAEFDAALDAAVEAAYDEGYEPMELSSMAYDETDEDTVATSMRRVELAKELVRQTERETAIEIARERERQRQMSLDQQSQTYGGGFFDANNSDEEEERMLEEMTRGYAMEDFTLGQQSRYQSGLPRQSDSSGLTSRTWHSSMGSNPPTGATTLSAVSEVTPSGNLRKPPSPPMPPPTQSLPQPPIHRPSSTAGVRKRRLSGQNAKQLKIETSTLGLPTSIPPAPITTSSTPIIQSLPNSSYIAQQRQALSAVSTRPGPFSMRAPSSPIRGISPADAAGPASPPGGQNDEAPAGSPSSGRPGMHKNFSSSSLRSLKSRQISVSHIDDADPFPMTPLSQQVSNTSVTRLPMMPALPTPIVTTFGDKLAGGIGGLHLFDSDFHTPGIQSPSPAHHYQQQNPDVPLPLEPCPSEPMFRPFWLMRALYQTLAHPRGGYVSTRLFVPQEAWKVKGVKLRNIEDKISQCDLLTAALLKLARVDSTDADAMLDEMQSFENILETVQNTLSRRLGTEVGTQGMITLKDEKEAEAPPVPRNNSISGKAGAFSWRRLRSKGSAVNLASTYGVKINTGSGSANGVHGIPEGDVISPGGSMPSLPMVAHPSSRPAKRDVTSVKFDGPNAHYMGSLARLFDAAQTVDQIARQVDDPGLRHADKTQVGLELCTRHAAEFFGFYICRFVLTDLGMLLDKFVKRGSEWVLL
ncbi:putative GTP-binding protein [Rosellinia necatrix]|uniref:Putative GTP-binding protein n=1 Tax=Rosellinia necatrix TaxID=77044 RepID=A0A1S7UJ05_ROSNE|nr:putative GTP-binding protein [Rosellinia necatrix]